MTRRPRSDEPSGGRTAAGDREAATAPAVAVWDRPVRWLHWTLAAAVFGAGLTTEWWVGAHQPLGWLAAVAVAVRLLWGFVGSRHARFAHFVRSPRATLAYLAQWRLRREPRFVGHNPLGGWMVVVLLAWVLGLALTGWLYTTDRFFGDETVERVHLALAWTLPVLVVLHVAGVAHASRRHGENLLRAMFDGCKRAPSGRDVG